MINCDVKGKGSVNKSDCDLEGKDSVKGDCYLNVIRQEINSGMSQTSLTNTKSCEKIHANYALNKELNLKKKQGACEKDVYKVKPCSSCCVIEFNTASFEYFKNDVMSSKS